MSARNLNFLMVGRLKAGHDEHVLLFFFSRFKSIHPNQRDVKKKPSPVAGRALALCVPQLRHRSVFSCTGLTNGAPVLTDSNHAFLRRWYHIAGTSES